MKLFQLAMSGLGAAALFLTACSSAQTTQAPTQEISTEAPGPAMWRLSDEDTEIVFLGTVHKLRDGVDWERPELTALYFNADMLYLEMDHDAVTPEENLQFVFDGKARSGAYLSDVLTPEQYERISAFAAENDASMDWLNTKKPWVASLVLNELAMADVGYSNEFGVETVLIETFEDLDIPVRGLERITYASGRLSALSMDQQVRMLMDVIDTPDERVDEFEAAIEAWQSGDIILLDQLVMKELRTDFPEIYEILLVDRNKRWVPVILDILENEEGTIIIAVGAGHLAGPDSLIDMLSDEGLDAERF